MSGNTGGQQPQMIHYYYMAVSQGNMAQQGQDGLNPGQFDGSQQPQQAFGMVQQMPQGGYGYGEQGPGTMGGVTVPSLGHMPSMMATAQPGTAQMIPGNAMLVPTMMPGQQGQGTSMGQTQAPTQMDQQPDQSQGGQWGMQQQGQGGQDQGGQQQSTRTPTQGSRAFKIVNPHTNEEVKGKEGFDQSGGMQGGMVQPGGGQQYPGQIQQGPQMQQAMPQQQQQPSPQVPQQQPTPQPPNVQPGPAASAASPVPPGTAPKKKMALKNMKLEKGGAAPHKSEGPGTGSPVPPSTWPHADSSAQSGQMAAGPGGAAACGAPVGDLAQRTGSAARSPGSAQNSAAPSPEMPGRKPEQPAGSMTAPISNRMPTGGGGQSSQFASAIKALNLEPMRSQLAPQNRQRPVMKSHGALDLPLVPSEPPSQRFANQQNQQQPQQQPQQSPPQQQTQPQQQGQAQQQGQQNFGQQNQQQGAPSPVMPQSQMQMQHQMMQQPMSMPQQMQMPMQMGPMHMHGGQMMMQVPMMQPQQPAAPAAPASAAPAKSKGIKLKNAALARVAPKKEDGGDASSNQPPQSEEPARSPVVPITSPQPATKSTRLCLKPENNIFDRSLMLRIWRSHRLELHSAVQGLHVGTRAGDKGGAPVAAATTPADRRRGARNEAADRSSIFGTDMRTGKGKQKPEKEPSLKVSDTGYRVKKPLGREDELERRVRGLLNKICPDNLSTIIDRLAEIELHKADELDAVIRIIFGKALAEPHYCETYADMVLALRTRYPEFPPENEGEKPQTFTRVLLNTCQEEFESLPQTFEPTEEERQRYTPEDLQLEMKKRKDKILANMKLIGNLFLRHLLAVKVIGQVVHDLIGIKERNPEEHMIECVCELLQAIGYTLDGTPQEKALMGQFAARLLDLKGVTDREGKQVYSKRIQFRIQDLLDLRSNKWQKKLFKEQAKTKDEVRKEAMAEARKHGKGGADVMFTTEIAGVRPAYIEASKGAGTGQKQRKGPEVVFDQPYVKKLCQYFADDRNSDELVENWNEAQPSSTQAIQGIEWILEIGFNDRNKEELMADIVVELLVRRVVSWEHLRVALQPSLEGLENLQKDVPNCDKFFHSLMSRLVMKFGKDFNCSILQPLNIPAEGSDFAWKLLVGALRRCKDKGGKEGYQKALGHNDLVQAACKARRCTETELKARLRDEGL